jgi:chromosome segregation ATPase
LWIDRGGEISSLADTINQKDSEIRELVIERSKVIQDLTEINSKNNELTKKLSSTTIRLESMKSRQETVFKKPKLVEKMINKSYTDFEKEIECTTGSKSSYCQ